MHAEEPLARAEAAEYAAWFRALADPTRIQIVSLLGRRRSAMTVGEIVTAVGVGQSTVSQHLKVLATVRFVLVEHRGTASYYRLSRACLDYFPSAADVAAGRRPPGTPAPGAAPPGAASPGAAPPDGRDGHRASGITVRPMRDSDAAQVLAIYQAGLDAGDASFETEAPSWPSFDSGKLPDHRHVAVDDTSGEVLGWAAVSAVSSRCVYAGVVEHSVYVAGRASRRGVGLALLRALAESTEAAGIWTIGSGIFPENAASLRLHERAGFRVVGTRERMGRHHGRWRDVVLVERRSPSAGAG
jgi:L-amino acid N-acyltransferase YncA/DNA-binding transcriptional ArsR family regulator